jgi:hypothetical protein
MSDEPEIRELKPNENGSVSLKVTMDDRKLGYMLVKDWNGTQHRFDLRKSEDYLSFPVPKVDKADAKK